MAGRQNKQERRRRGGGGETSGKDEVEIDGRQEENMEASQTRGAALPSARGSGGCCRRASSAPGAGVPALSGWWRAGPAHSLLGTEAVHHSALLRCSPLTTCPPPSHRGPCNHTGFQLTAKETRQLNDRGPEKGWKQTRAAAPESGTTSWPHTRCSWRQFPRRDYEQNLAKEDRAFWHNEEHRHIWGGSLGIRGVSYKVNKLRQGGTCGADIMKWFYYTN